MQIHTKDAKMAISWLEAYFACHVSKSTMKPPLKSDKDYPDYKHQNYLLYESLKTQRQAWDWVKVEFYY